MSTSTLATITPPTTAIARTPFSRNGPLSRESFTIESLSKGCAAHGHTVPVGPVSGRATRIAALASIGAERRAFSY